MRGCCLKSWPRNTRPERQRRTSRQINTAAARAEKLQKSDPKNANAFYLHAFALGCYAQGISIVKALKDGIGTKVKNSLDSALKLAPKHVDAHIASGAYHAEIIDSVGAMLGGLTYGAKKDLDEDLFAKALKLNPDSAIARIEMANGLIILHGKFKAMDAMERLDVEQAKAELE